MNADSPIIMMVSRFMIPFIQLYGMYVYTHGEVGPGGGFQAGVIIAASFVLLGMVYGWDYGRSQLKEGISDLLAPTGALIYALIGLGALFAGGAFLEYAAYTSPDPHHVHLAHHVGLIGIELGVTITVTAAMATLYFEMSREADADADGLADNYPADRDPGDEGAR